MIDGTILVDVSGHRGQRFDHVARYGQAKARSCERPLRCPQPDLSDCPPVKRARGRLPRGIGGNGPMGRVLVRGYERLVLSDRVASYFPQLRQASPAIVAAQGGIFGCVRESAQSLSAMPAGVS